MDIFTDWRIILLFIITMATNAYFLYRSHKHTGRWTYHDSTNFNWMEAIFSFVLFSIVTTGLWYWGRNIRVTSYIEQIGGFITAHYAVDGEHSEERCSGSGEDEVCWNVTVYHREFIVETNIGQWFDGWRWSEIVDKSSEDGEPYRIPDFYLNTFVGKPVSFDNSYPNYIAAMNHSIYRNTYNGYSAIMPDICPPTPDIRRDQSSVYRILPLGFAETSPVRADVYSWNFYTGDASWFPQNTDISLQPLSIVPVYGDTLFGYLGGKVQADTHIYVINSANTGYSDMCLAKWKNGAKNSVYVFIFGTENNGVYQPTDVRVNVAVDGTNKNSELEFANDAERSNYYMKLDIRNQLLTYFENGGILDRNNVLTIISTNVDNTFVRQEMATFKGLIRYVFPTTGWIIFMAVILIVADVILHLNLANNDF